MPIYEYICDDCGTKFEKLVRRNQIGDRLPQLRRVAPENRSLNLRRSFVQRKSPGVQAQFPSCAGGMCQTPDLCGRN